MARIGIVGTGFIVKQALQVIDDLRGSKPTGCAVANPLEVTRVLTRRPLDSVEGIRSELLTQSVDALIESSDIVFESTGDPLHATVVVERALRAGRKVVTMNAELHVTTGSYLAGLGYLSEADGDQPGALALLRNEALGMGFEPLAYVNIKGFLNHNPDPAEMKYWSERQGLSLVETTSFTDGTKLHVEQALCANAFDAAIAEEGLIGGAVGCIEETDYLAQRARKLGRPISDYVQCSTAPPGVFLLAEHPVSTTLPHYGPYEKLRTKGGAAYLLLRPYHLCGLEVAKSLQRTAAGAPPLLNNGEVPRVSVAAIAKKPLPRGAQFTHAIGGFEVRGSAVRTVERPDHVPIGLLQGARLKRPVDAGQIVDFDDVELPESRAASLWTDELLPRVIAS
ncbi:homoserine dehydrogenase [Posidoniimonas polymericola]|uniref:Homoserine dehydrogenase n=1 Tax=Posidoniimonas polymericola TaxID=2528002 RepID=A0A5C5YRI0_9BACT|nr:hypothetical protein [Posidoniimonas polymericola]TWT77495.1 homoserine dehydrogenase [Posidoniimonas polymericola]